MTFPAEAVPDGAIGAPHHLYAGALFAMFVAYLVSNDVVGRDAAFVLGGCTVALFAFASIWPWYHAAGAALTIIGLFLATYGVVATDLWTTVPTFARAAVAVGLVVAWDDVVSHALGVWTPVDALWRAILLPLLMRAKIPV